MKFSEFLAEKGVELEGLSANEQAGLYNEYNEKREAELTAKIENKASKEDIAALKSELADQRKEQYDALKDLLKKESKKIADKKSADTIKEESFSAALVKSLSDKQEGLSKLKYSSSAQDNVKFTVKAAGDMSIDNNVTSGQVPQAFRVPGLNAVASRQVRIFDLVSTGSIGSNLVEWVYQANKDGSAGQTAEGGAKNQIDFDLTVGSQKVEKTTAYITVTDEMLDDVSYMAAEINNELTRELLKAVESGIYSGDGNSPNLNGIYTVATAFSAPSDLVGFVDNANEIDVLVAASTQIKVADQSVPNAIMMNPIDVAKLKLIKVSSTDKRYVDRLVESAGMLMLDGIPIIESTVVTAGTYLIGDFTKANVLTKQGITIEIGYNADNFVKNYKTIRAEWRGVCYVKNNDRTAFVKGTFATDKASLETT
jgi:HK97 family phage major capsid protein